MTLSEPGGAVSGVVERAKNLLVQPRAEWERIADERATLSSLLTGYVLPLAVFSALCVFIGLSVTGVSAHGVTARDGLIAGAAAAVLQVVLSLAWVWAFGLIINALAPIFSAERDSVRANQLAAYAPTALMAASVFILIPPLSFLAGLGALYSLMLLYMGLLRLMKAPSEKRTAYFLSIVGIAVAAGFITLSFWSGVRAAFGPASGLSAALWG